MTFEAIASSSHGNAYVLDDGQTRILIECGLAFRTLGKALGGYAGIDAVLVSHEHKDHARCAQECVKAGLPVYMSCGTALALGLAEERRIEIADAPASALLKESYAVEGRGVELIEAGEQVRIGTMIVLPFRTFHDAREPLGFVVLSKVDGEELVFATDTVNLRYRFPGVTILAVEANYEASRLERCERMPEKVRHRIQNTHMEIDVLCEVLRGMELSRCRELWLLHLSDACSHEGQFINKVKRIVPKTVHVFAAGR